MKKGLSLKKVLQTLAVYFVNMWASCTVDQFVNSAYRWGTDVEDIPSGLTDKEIWTRKLWSRRVGTDIYFKTRSKRLSRNVLMRFLQEEKYTR